MNAGCANHTISSLDCVSFLYPDDYKLLRDLLKVADTTMRTELASQLVRFINQDSKDLLFLLAHDKNPVVRANAYDSLSVFCFPDVEEFFIRAIDEEQDQIARNYIILSLADVSYALHQDHTLCITRFLRLLDSEESPQCILSILRALYMMGDERRLSSILSFLDHENYQIRCSAVSVLHDILSINNKDTIIEALRIMLRSEKTRAVALRVDSLFEGIIHGSTAKSSQC